MASPTCESCRWFVEADRANREALGIERIGHCYVRPPALPNGARPMSFPRDFCGEHAPRVESSDRPDFREVEAARGCLDPESPDASV